jgi:hypothetical protein
MSNTKILCDKCGYDGTYYKPPFHYHGLAKRVRCDGTWKTYEVFTREEKLALFRVWLEQAVELSDGMYAKVRQQVLDEFDKANNAPLQSLVTENKTEP